MNLRILLLAVSAGIAITPATAQADPRTDVIDALVKCTDLHDAAARLACFDQNTPQLRAVAGPAQAAAAAAPQPAPPPPAPPPKAVALAAPPPVATQPPPKPVKKDEGSGSWFSGLDPFAGGGDVPGPTARQMAYQPIGQEILPITIAVSSFYVGSDGSFTITLANDQVWRALHGYTSPPRFQDDKVNLVTIDHAMLGGYNLSVRGTSGLFKVERVK